MQQTERKPLFDLGQLVATPGAPAALEKTGQNAMHFLSRYVRGDWADIARFEDLSRTTLDHIKHFLIGTFRYARRKGVLEAPNPMQDVEIPKARPAGETHAYSLEEEAQMLAILPEPTATVVAAAALTGARKGEIRGFTWENYAALKFVSKNPYGQASTSRNARRAEPPFQS